MYKMIKELKQSVALAQFGSTATPSLSVSSPSFHHDSFGEDSAQNDVLSPAVPSSRVDPPAPPQGEPFSSSALEN